MKRIAFASTLVVAVGCGGSNSTPTTPSTPPTQSPTRIMRLESNLDFGSVILGDTVERILRIYSDGNSTLTVTSISVPAGGALTASWTQGTIGAGSNQSVTMRFTPTEERSYVGTLRVNADQTSGANTIPVNASGARPPGPRTSFGAGRYLVGTDIAPGRYFSNPSTSGCYWERQSGLGGSLSDIIANDFIGFDPDQLIVDIDGADRAFRTDGDCGIWFQTPRRPAQASVTPGLWLVGAQVSPGVYRSNVKSGCYWARLRDFGGQVDAIIDNEFISSSSPQVMEIRPGDTGFWSDSDCGTWIPEPNSAAGILSRHAKSQGDIVHNRDRARDGWPTRR